MTTRMDPVEREVRKAVAHALRQYNLDSMERSWAATSVFTELRDRQLLTEHLPVRSKS